MTLLDISQIGITLFGVTAFLLVTREEVKFQKMERRLWTHPVQARLSWP